MADRETRSFGAWVLLLADGLLMAGLLLIYGGIRSRVKEWPDVVESAIVGAFLPLLMVGALCAGAVLHRSGRRLVAVFFAIAAAAVILILTWIDAQSIGLTARSGRYAMIVYLVLLTLSANVAGALIATARGVLQGRSTSETPLLGRFLTFLAVASAVFALAVFAA